MNKPKALGAYIFAGGFTVGVKEHFDVLAHFEEGPYGVATARLNFPDLPIFVGPESWPIEDETYHDLDLLYGNPPCAAWSRAGVKLHDTRNWRTDPRVLCTRKHFGLLEELSPKVWVWESVEQTFKDGRELIDELAQRALDRGYAVTLFVFDGRYLGLPQRRKRFFFIAHRVKLTLDQPDWSTTTCGDALRVINDIGEPYAGTIALAKRLGWLLPHCRPGSDLRKTFDAVMADKPVELNHLGQVKGRPGFLVRRCKADDVAPTVMHELVHPIEHRFLTLRELGALCGYPADFVIAPPASSMNELSRAVMPPVAEYLASMIAKAVKADEPITNPNVMVVDYRSPPGAIYEEVLGAPRSAPAQAPKASRLPRPVQEEPTRLQPTNPGGGRVGVPRPKPGVKRMAFLQVLIMMDRWTTEQMVTIVKRHWPESKVSAADVGTQRSVLRKKGYATPATRRQPAEVI